MGGMPKISIKMKSSKAKMSRKDHLSKTEKKEVKQIIAGKPEVKYFASSLNNYNLNVFPGATTPLATTTSSFGTSQGGFISLLAQCPAGTGPNERIGLKITPVKARTTWTFSLREPGNQGGAGLSPPQNYVVHLYVVEPKGYNNINTVSSIPAGEFLLQGNGLCTDPVVTNNTDQTRMLQIINNLKVNRNLYKVKMHKKFHISKNGGIQNLKPYTGSIIGSDATATPNLNPDSSIQTITYDWVPPKFKYNLPTDTLPNNHNPLFLVWATTVDGSPFPDNGAGANAVGMLTYGYINEYWFTDE